MKDTQVSGIGRGRKAETPVRVRLHDRTLFLHRTPKIITGKNMTEQMH